MRLTRRTSSARDFCGLHMHRERVMSSISVIDHVVRLGPSPPFLITLTVQGLINRFSSFRHGRLAVSREKMPVWRLQMVL